MVKIFFLFALLVLLRPQTFGREYLSITDQPACPGSGNTILDDTVESMADYQNHSEKKSLQKIFRIAEADGNIEGAPGGFGLVGDNLRESFTKDFCGNKKTLLKSRRLGLLLDT